MKLFRNKITAGILIASQFMYGVPVYAEKYTSEPTSRINGRAPVASNLAFDKLIPAFGDTVTLTYDFSDLDGDLEQGTTVQWLRDGQPIQGATAFSYTVAESNGDRPGERLSVEVTPRTDPARSEPSVGQVASLETTVYGDPAAKPVVSDLNIVGKLSIGEALTGVYSYDDNGSGSADASTYKWGVKDSTANGVASGDQVTNSGVVPGYTLRDTDAGQVLEVSVQAKNQAGTVGNTDTKTTANSTGTTGGDGAGGVINLNVAPVIADLTINGKLNVGENLTGQYTYDANGSGSADASTYKWGVKDSTANGVASGDQVTNSGVVPGYTLRDTDAGQVLEVSVQAKNQAGTVGNTDTKTTANSTGTTGGDGAGGVINLNVAPVIADLTINGKLNVGENLTGQYTYDANGSGSADASTYKWGVKDSTANGVASGDQVTNSGVVPGYTLRDTDAGQVLEVSVQAKNQAGTVGNTDTKTTANSTGTTGGDGAGGVINLNVAPVIADLTINGKLNVGENLTGQYTYDANGSGSADASTYKWGVKDSTANGVASGDQVTNSGVVPGYTLRDTDAGQVLEVSVQAKNQAGTVGNTDTKTTANSTGTTGGDGAGGVINLNVAPVIADLTINGKLNVGENLTGQYTYDANGSGSADASTYKWGVKDSTANGVASGDQVTNSGVVPGYTLRDTDAGQVLEVSVQAKNQAGTVGNTDTKTTANSTGTTGGDGAGGVINLNVAPVIADLTINGKLNVGENLTGQYTYDANGSGSADASTYKWGVKDSTANGVASGDQVTNSGVVPGYTLRDTDAGQVLEVSVQAKNQAGTVGNTDTKTTANSTGTTGGDGAGGVINLNVAPVIADLTINGKLNVGENLTGQYTYDANGSGSADASTYKWGVKDSTANGVASGDQVTNSGVVPGYTLRDTDAGQVLEVSVQAKNQAGTVGNTDTKTTANSTGTTGGDGAGGVINLNVAPVIADLTINGKLNVGENLTGQYTYDANGSGSADASTYKWGVKDSTANGVASGDQVTNSGVVPGYTLRDTDAGQVLEVSVQAKNQAGTVGNTDTKTTANSTGTTGGDGAGGVINLNVAPVIADLTINGKLNVGENLTGQYTYDANGSGSADASTYKWGVKDSTANGVASGDQVTNSGVVPGYTLRDTDAGQVLEVSVQAKNQAGTVGNTDTKTTANSTGTTGGDGAGGVINLNVAPVIADLTINGKLNVGENLTGQYTYDANGSGSADASTYKWGVKDSTANGVASGDQVTNSGVVPGYTLRDTDAGQVLEVSVQAKNQAGTVGNTDTKTTANSTGTTGGDGAGGVINLNVAPVIADLTINGKLNVGENLTGQYTYDANGSGSADASTYKWGVKDSTANGVASGDKVINSGVVPGYTLRDTDAGQVLEVSVQAKNLAGVAGNVETKTTANSTGGTGGTVIDSSKKPQIDKLSISGILDQNQVLTATYTYNDPNGGSDSSTYAWGLVGTTEGAVDNSTDVVTGNGTVQSPPLDLATYSGRVVELTMLPKNNLEVPLIGNKVMATTELPPSVTDLKIKRPTSEGYTVMVGQTLEAEFKPVGNNIGVTNKIQWYRAANAIPTATNKTYQLVFADQNETITFKVTPVSTTNLNGVEKISASLGPVASAIRPFIQPKAKRMSWNAARNFCASRGGKLAESSDLQQIFTRLTGAAPAGSENAQGNKIMNTIYGWPFTEDAPAYYYWANDQPSSEEGYAVDMNNGYRSKNYTETNMQVACIAGSR
ncbi:hypothetical protein [Pseudomonas sp. FP2294]|uniref:hypothetical protein n=1 Tax=Pseudomonas sp. FP2294 TaxID=2954089 RepID=UPI002734FDF7|nr:hypothetical protein [Pseudomonas sp. FP2294]WLH55572.1 hypothetical protein PSH73_16750 [Pseudomonas sp. FP2294]